MASLGALPVDPPEQLARQLLDRFAGDLAAVRRHIVDHRLAEALRGDDYDLYLRWRTVESLCAGLAADRRATGEPAPLADFHATAGSLANG